MSFSPSRVYLCPQSLIDFFTKKVIQPHKTQVRKVYTNMWLQSLKFENTFCIFVFSGPWTHV